MNYVENQSFTTVIKDEEEYDLKVVSYIDTSVYLPSTSPTNKYFRFGILLFLDGLTRWVRHIPPDVHSSVKSI